MISRLITTAALLFALGTAFADDNQLNIFDKQQFATYEVQIKTDFDTGVRYKEIAPDKQETVRKALDRMEQRWVKAGPDGKLNASDSIQMANDQEIIVTILSHAAADSRLVCNREVPMGSKIAVKVCRTIAQMKREQDSAQAMLRDAGTKTPQNPRSD